MDSQIIIIVVVVVIICISFSVSSSILMSGDEKSAAPAPGPSPASATAQAAEAKAQTAAPVQKPAVQEAPKPKVSEFKPVKVKTLSQEELDKMTADIMRKPPPKFIVGMSKNSGYNDEGNGNAVYLDRHNVNCEPDGVKRFRLVRDGQGKYRYDYTCSSDGDLGNTFDKDTGFNDEGNGNLIYLDRHNVDCGIDSALTQFQLTRDGQGKYRYNYKCTSSKKPLKCRDVTTPGNEDGGGNAVYLDRHDLACGDDEVMNRFRLVRPTDNTIQYQFKCCKY